ncbi:hypothetical protein Tco_0161610 [Tanacetum coccineum]
MRLFILLYLQPSRPYMGPQQYQSDQWDLQLPYDRKPLCLMPLLLIHFMILLQVLGTWIQYVCNCIVSRCELSFEVVDDPIGMSKAKQVEIGKFLLEDGKVFTLARKSSPGRNCVTLGEPCGALDRCCDPFYCDGWAWPITGKCAY